MIFTREREGPEWMGHITLGQMIYKGLSCGCTAIGSNVWKYDKYGLHEHKKTWNATLRYD